MQEIRAGRDREGRLMLQLYDQNLPLIRQAARLYSRSVELEDLLQEAYIGLSVAVDRWEPGHNASFITYALYWIRNSYMECLERCGASCVRIPRNQWQKLRQYHAAIKQFQQEHGRDPVPAELAAIMGITLAEVEQLRTLDRIRKPGSLDTPLPGLEDSTETLSDAIPDPSRPFDDVDEEIYNEQLKTSLRASVERLPALQRDLIMLRFFQPEGILSYKECAARAGVSVCTARDRIYKALRSLSQMTETEVDLYEDRPLYSRGLSGTGFWAFERTWTSATEREALRGM